MDDDRNVNVFMLFSINSSLGKLKINENQLNELT